MEKPKHIHQPGCKHFKPGNNSNPQEGTLFGKEGNVAATLRPDQEEAMRVVKRSTRALNAMLKDGVSPANFRPQLIRDYMKTLQRRAYPAGFGVEGQKLLALKYRRGGESIPLYWDWFPNSGRPIVVGLCPECLCSAPQSVGPLTKPTFFEQHLAWIAGDPEADSKFVTFKLESPHFTMHIDERDRLTIRELVKCPSGLSGPTKRIIRKCDWCARVEDGVITRTSRGIIKATGKHPITGPIIIVK